MHAHFNQMMSLRRLLKPGLPWKHKILIVGVGHPSSLRRSNEGMARPEWSHQEDNPQISRWAPQHLALSCSSHHLPQLIIFMGPGTANRLGYKAPRSDEAWARWEGCASCSPCSAPRHAAPFCISAPKTAPGVSATLLLEPWWRFMDGVGSLPATAGIPLYLRCHILHWL